MAAGGGEDWAGECSVLFSQTDSLQARAAIQGIRIEARQAKVARERRAELLRQALAAAHRAGFWAKLGKILGGTLAAISALCTVVCPAAAAGVALGAALARGVPSSISAGYNLRAAQARAGGMRSGLNEQQAKEFRDGWARALGELALDEQRIAARLREILEAEHAMIRQPLAGRRSRP
jgi:hypothetical protein